MVKARAKVKDVCVLWLPTVPTLQKDTHGLPVSRVTASTHTLSPFPRPTHLVGLEIIVQRKLQFAQVLWLFLLLAFAFPLCQARLCIVIILGELQAGRGFKRGVEQPFAKTAEATSKPPKRDSGALPGDTVGRSTCWGLCHLRVEGRQHPG